MATQYDHQDGISQLSEMIRNGQVSDDTVVPSAPVDPAVRQRRRRRRLIAVVVVIVVLLAAIGGYVVAALTAPVGAANASAHRPDVAAPAAVVLALPPAGESAVSVAGADAYLGPTASGILAAGGGDAAVPIASISKLITALVVLDAKPLAEAEPGPTLTFDKADHDLYDKYYLLNATIAAMPTGSSMSEHDALETMLVVSACNYAEAVAGWAFGSQAGFVSATKKWLAANGLTNTTMVEPTGVDARNTSTPSDMIALGKLAMANPVVAAIVAKTRLDVPLLQGMPNTNNLLGTDGVNGIKTGTLDNSGSNLLYSAVLPYGDGGQLSIIGVVLGGYTRESVDADVRALLASITAGFHDVPVGTRGQVVGTYSTPWGAKASMILATRASVFTWSDTPITSTMTTTPLKTGADGESVGSVTWTSGTSTVTVPVVLEGTIAPPSAWWRLTHPFELWR